MATMSEAPPTDFARLPSLLSLPLDLMTYYETRTHVIVVATNALKEEFRILQLTKSSTKLSYFFDPVVYTRDHAVSYVNKMKGLDGSSSSSSSGAASNPNGALISSGRAKGIIGFVRFFKGYYMLLIKDRRLVTRLGPHSIYEVQGVTYVSLCEPNTDSLFSRLRYDDEDRYLALFKGFDLSRYFYYCHTYDLTNTLQTNMTRPHNVMRGWEKKAAAEVIRRRVREERAVAAETEKKRLQKAITNEDTDNDNNNKQRKGVGVVSSSSSGVFAMGELAENTEEYTQPSMSDEGTHTADSSSKNTTRAVSTKGDDDGLVDDTPSTSSNRSKNNNGSDDKGKVKRAGGSAEEKDDASDFEEDDTPYPSSIRDAPDINAPRRSKFIWNHFLLLPTKDSALFGGDHVKDGGGEEEGLYGKERSNKPAPLGSSGTYDSAALRAAEWRAWAVPLIHGCISEAELVRSPCPRTNPDGTPYQPTSNTNNSVSNNTGEQHGVGPTATSGSGTSYQQTGASSSHTGHHGTSSSPNASSGSAKSGGIIKVLLIGRSSKRFAGTRYLKRGINADGYVANHVEVEQIVYDPATLTRYDTVGAFSSFVQVRGSVPVSWYHPPVNRPKPPIVIGFNESLYTYTRRHMEDLISDFGAPVVVVNLLKSAKAERKKSREKYLSEEYTKALLTLATIAKPASSLTNHSINVEVSDANDDGSITHLLALPPESPSGTNLSVRRPPRKLFATDFNTGEEELEMRRLAGLGEIAVTETTASRGVGSDACSGNRHARRSLANFGSQPIMTSEPSPPPPPPNHCEESAAAVTLLDDPAHICPFAETLPLPWRLLQYVEFDLRNSSDKAWNCMTSIAEARIPQVGIFSCDSSGAVKSLQCGVLRSNCVDCIDRTNLGQFFFGLHAIGEQLAAISVLKDRTDTCLSEGLNGLVLELYLRLGDAIAIQYGGSAQVGAGLLHRGLGWDKIMGIRRLYTNLLVDKDRQTVTNLFLGLYTPMYRGDGESPSTGASPEKRTRGPSSASSGATLLGAGRYGALSKSPQVASSCNSYSSGGLPSVPSMGLLPPPSLSFASLSSNSAASEPTTAAAGSIGGSDPIARPPPSLLERPSSTATASQQIAAAGVASSAPHSTAPTAASSTGLSISISEEKMQIPFQVHHERNFLGKIVCTTIDTERYIDIADIESDYYLHTSAPKPLEKPPRDWWRGPLIAFHRRRDPYFGTPYGAAAPILIPPVEHLAAASPTDSHDKNSSNKGHFPPVDPTFFSSAIVTPQSNGAVGSWRDLKSFVRGLNSDGGPLTAATAHLTPTTPRSLLQQQLMPHVVLSCLQSPQHQQYLRNTVDKHHCELLTTGGGEVGATERRQMRKALAAVATSKSNGSFSYASSSTCPSLSFGEIASPFSKLSTIATVYPRVNMPVPPSFITVDHNGMLCEPSAEEMNKMAAQVYTSIRIGIDEGVFEIERVTPADANDVRLFCTLLTTDSSTTNAVKRCPFLTIDHRPIQRLSQSALVLNPEASFVTQQPQFHDFGTFAESVKESYFAAEEEKYRSLPFWQGPSPPRKYRWNVDDPSQNRPRRSKFAPHPTQLAEAYKGTKSTPWEWRHKRMAIEEVQFVATSIYHHGSPLDSERDWSCEHLCSVIRALDPDVPDEYIHRVADVLGYNSGSVYFMRVVPNDAFGREYTIYTDNLRRILAAVHASLTPIALLQPAQDSLASYLSSSAVSQPFTIDFMDPSDKMHYQLEATVVDYGDDGKPKVIPRPAKHYLDAIPEISPYWKFTTEMKELLCSAVSNLRLVQPTVSTFSRFIDPPLNAANIEEVLVRLMLELTHPVTGIPLSNCKRFCRTSYNPLATAVAMPNVFTIPVFTSWLEENSAACGLRFHRMQPRKRYIAIRQFADLLVNSGVVVKLEVPTPGSTGIVITSSHPRDYEDEGVLFTFANVNGQVALNLATNTKDSMLFLKESRAVELSLLIASTALALLKSYEDFICNWNGRDKFKELPRLTAVTAYLQGADITTLCVEERICFFINVYNALYIHAWIHVHQAPRPVPIIAFYQTMCYNIGNHMYSLHDIKHGILRGNTPSSLMLFPQFLLDDSRKVLSVGFVNELTGRIIYALIDTYVVHERANYVNSYNAGAKRALNHDDPIATLGESDRDSSEDEGDEDDNDDDGAGGTTKGKGDNKKSSRRGSSGPTGGGSNSSRRNSATRGIAGASSADSGAGGHSPAAGGGGIVGAAARVFNDVPWLRSQRKTAEAANICRPMDPATLYKQLNELEIQFAYRTMGWALPWARVQQANALSDQQYAQTATTSSNPTPNNASPSSVVSKPSSSSSSVAVGGIGRARSDSAKARHPSELPPEIIALRAQSAAHFGVLAPHQSLGGSSGVTVTDAAANKEGGGVNNNNDANVNASSGSSSANPAAASAAGANDVLMPSSGSSASTMELTRDERIKIVQPLSGLEEFGQEAEDILARIERIAQTHHERRHKAAAQRKSQQQRARLLQQQQQTGQLYYN